MTDETQPKNIFGWVIEHRDSEACSPRYWTGNTVSGFTADWSSDRNEALRFSRKKDADRIRASFLLGVSGGHRIAEHGWINSDMASTETPPAAKSVDYAAKSVDYAAKYAAAKSVDYAAKSVDYAAKYAAAKSAEYAAAKYARYAKYAVESAESADQELVFFAEEVVKVLIAMKAPGAEWLDLTEAV